MRIFVLLIFFIFVDDLKAQSIFGNFSSLANQEIKLEGFKGLKTYTIATVRLDEKGNFKLKFAVDDYGVGYLISVDKKPLFVILCAEDIEIIGQSLSNTNFVKIINGQQNQWFEQYAREHPRREQALRAWMYLESLYTSDPLFAAQQIPFNTIREEKLRIKSEDNSFVEALPNNSYLKWYLPTRQLVSSVASAAQSKPEEISSVIQAFRKMDYTDWRLYKSGLFKDAIEGHFWLIENSGKNLDSVFIEMKISIDGLMANLIADENKLNEVTDFLFNLLEKHSLFQASEYLALKMLNEKACTLNNDLVKQLESYRTMKKGNIAPDIVFDGDVLSPAFLDKKLPQKLSELKLNNSLVVFGASWCPKCVEELPEIALLYPKWKSQGLEVIFVSLDENRESFRNFVSPFPFLSCCDYKKWEGRIIKDYCVFGTPTLFLLDSDRKIILRPNSAKQVDAWVDWNLKGVKN